MQVSKQRTRHNTAPSDPFNDPAPITSYSSYGVPTLSRNAPLQNTSRPPPPPPKTTPSRSTPKRNLTAVHTTPNRQNTMEAVRDTVVIRSSDQSPRNRMGRSNTELPAPVNVKTTLPPPARRSHSQDSVVRAANTVEKAKASGRPRGNKKGSTHADVIDRLDFSGVGPMFHHDGPFDACAPSRNRHRTKAPMLAWASGAEADKMALANARDIDPGRYNTPYPSPNIYVPYEAPKKSHDVIAEAWGIHEPEPFEDFSAGGGYSARPSGEHGSTRNGNGNGNASAKRPKDNNKEAREVYRHHLDDGRRTNTNAGRQQAKRPIVPPPQPIFAPEGEVDVPQPPSPSGAPASPGAPKRNKSLMGRIRKMRDNPNVPAIYDDDARIVAGGRDPSPPSSTENSHATYGSQPARPTHRSQNSFLGRFGRSTNFSGGARSDNTATSPSSEEAYVYVDDPAGVPLNKEKSLPATPGADKGGDYFDPNAAMPGSPDSGLARKSSLLRKVKGVVRGAAK